tara:strand:- start:567 stop:809 length:243 start_codon:yes stop_codon:yes gene_type:complete
MKKHNLGALCQGQFIKRMLRRSLGVKHHEHHNLNLNQHHNLNLNQHQLRGRLKRGLQVLKLLLKLNQRKPQEERLSWVEN